MTRIHIVSLPHTLLTRDYDWCAYTAKVRRLIGMLADAGIEALVYGPDVVDEDVREQATEYIPVVFDEDRVNWFGSLEWDSDQVFDRWNEDDACWQVMNIRAAQEIRPRWQTGDILGVIGGLCQLQIAQELSDLGPLVCEWGIGYSGVIESSHKVFESYAWMHHVAARRPNDDFKAFDAVIPNCFDVKDFDESYTHGDYLLYMGRPNPRKGLPIIADIAARSAYPVLMAGQPGPEIPNTTHVGLVTGKRKRELLAGARAVLVPTTYLEPFGGVAVEAMMSGTPVITTDYGAFTETVVEGVTGFRCRTLRDFLDAVEKVANINRHKVRNHAVARYSTDAGSQMYGTYLSRLESLYADGWYADTPEPRLREG